jgi:hypothetical protein
MQKKTLNKIQHTFKVEVLEKLGIEGADLNIIKANLQPT